MATVFRYLLSEEIKEKVNKIFPSSKFRFTKHRKLKHQLKLCCSFSMQLSASIETVLRLTLVRISWLLKLDELLKSAESYMVTGWTECNQQVLKGL